MKTGNFWQATLAVLVLSTSVLYATAQSGNRQQQTSRKEQQSSDSKNTKSTQQTTNVGKVARNQVTYKKSSQKVSSVRELPSQTKTATHNNVSYHYDDKGKFYTNHGGRYVNVAPSVGLRVSSIPSGSVSVSLGNLIFYYFEGIFYNKVSGGYEVAQPEVGVIVDALPAGYEKVEIRGVAYYEYNNVLYQKVKTGRGSGYEVVGYID